LNCNVDEILDRVELYTCSICYNSLFWNNINEEVADISLQERIRSLHWVTYGFLDIGIKLEDRSIREIFDNAITECRNFKFER
uniref:Uncharacterized protein n=1 Tax=Romanomermis culicivorax TaxID=13658 RepID=A0A915I131_ROMCU